MIDLMTLTHASNLVLKVINKYLRPWINRTMSLNYISYRSCEMTFLIYKKFYWKFRKNNKRQWSTSVNSFLVTILKKIERLIDNYIIKEVGLRSIRVKYKEENPSLCHKCSDVSLAMALPTSSGFIKFEKNTK